MTEDQKDSEYFGGKDERKSKDDFDYLKPDRKQSCFITDEKGNTIMIISQLMYEQKIYLRGKIPVLEHEKMIPSAARRYYIQKFWDLFYKGMFSNKQKLPQQYYG